MKIVFKSLVYYLIHKYPMFVKIKQQFIYLKNLILVLTHLGLLLFYAAGFILTRPLKLESGGSVSKSYLLGQEKRAEGRVFETMGL